MVKKNLYIKMYMWHQVVLKFGSKFICPSASRLEQCQALDLAQSLLGMFVNGIAIVLVWASRFLTYVPAFSSFPWASIASSCFWYWCLSIIIRHSLFSASCEIYVRQSCWMKQGLVVLFTMHVFCSQFFAWFVQLHSLGIHVPCIYNLAIKDNTDGEPNTKK